jgi:hypothetical protein
MTRGKHSHDKPENIRYTSPAMHTLPKFRVEILPLKADDGFFVRLVSSVTGAIIESPAFPTDSDAMKWVEGRMGLRT